MITEIVLVRNALHQEKIVTQILLAVARIKAVTALASALLVEETNSRVASTAATACATPVCHATTISTFAPLVVTLLMPAAPIVLLMSSQRTDVMRIPWLAMKTPAVR